ncbi:MAG: hypothetical protein M5U34_24380 [Chloroflexi bacterium]|nr:hypothetical protein [Chloroflexota bacterium]
MITTEFQHAMAQASHIMVITHVGPDGDALGSLTATGQVLQAAGKTVTLVVDSAIPPAFHFYRLSTRCVIE